MHVYKELLDFFAVSVASSRTTIVVISSTSLYQKLLNVLSILSHDTSKRVVYSPHLHPVTAVCNQRTSRFKYYVKRLLITLKKI